MNKIDDFEYGQFVMYDGKVMLVYGVPYEEEDEGYPDQIQLIEEKSLRVYDKEEESECTKYILAPVIDVIKLPYVKVSEETLRSFFRIDTTPWKLCAEGLYPIAKESGSFILSEDDVETFLSRLGSIDPVVYGEWQTQFVFGDHVKTQNEDPNHFTLKMVWNLMRDDFEWYDAEEDEPEYIQAIWDFYKLNKGKELDQINFPDEYKNTVISDIYLSSKENPISDMQKQTYIKLLDEQVAAGDHWAIRHKAYAYYGGNSIVPCDWKKAEETLLKLHDTQTEDAKYAANSLGYIYYSDRLGEPDYEKAFRYFSEAAEYGIIEATYKLADMYRKGHGTKKQTQKAFLTYKRLYESEFKKFKDNHTGCKLADVSLRMGYCYENGEGVKTDLFRALEYYQMANNAIDARIAKHKHFGDETVKRNIDNSILRITDKLENSPLDIIDEKGKNRHE